MLQLAITIWGIVILVKRKVSLTKKKVVTGGPAVAIGIMFIALLPLSFVMGLVLGFVIVAQGGMQGAQQDLMKYGVFIDFGLLALVIIAAFVIANIYGRDPTQVVATPDSVTSDNEPLPPADPDNPYAAPPR